MNITDGASLMPRKRQGQAAKRAALLLNALDMSQIAKDLRREKPENSGYARRVLEIQVADVEAGGGSSNGGIEIDVITARKLMPVIRDFIKAELKSLGIKQ